MVRQMTYRAIAWVKDNDGNVVDAKIIHVTDVVERHHKDGSSTIKSTFSEEIETLAGEILAITPIRERK